MTKIQDTKPIKQKPVGCWNVSGGEGQKPLMVFATFYKPNLVQRTLVKWLLGWEWIEKES